MSAANGRRLLVLLAALTVLLLVTASSALAGVGTQTRVGAFNLTDPIPARGQATESAWTHQDSIAAEAATASGFCVATEDAATAAPDLENLSSKIEGDLLKRGWTPQEIQEAYDNGEQIPAINEANGAAATRYVNPTTGNSVVIENDTGQVIHVGGEGFKYGPGSGDLP